MNSANLSVIAILVLAGIVVFGLETGALDKFKGYAVASLVILVAGAIGLFLLNESQGKIDWGDPIKKAEKKKGDKKDASNGDDGGDDGGGGGSGDDGNGDGGGKAENDGSGSGNKIASAAEDEGGKSSNVQKEKLKDCDVCPLMVVMPRGSFTMGAPETEPGRRYYEGPIKPVQVPKNIAVSQMEITRAQYQAFIEETGHRSSRECIVNGIATAGADFRTPGFKQDPDHPVVCVSWKDADAYAAWLSEKSGKSYRLLSEAEWEYSARGGTKSMYSTLKAMTTRYANFGTSAAGTRSAAAYALNPYGLSNVHGNASEWVQDCWHDSHAGRPQEASSWMNANGGDCKSRVHRGGAWNSDATEIRSAARSYEPTTSARNTIGIRVAKTM